jgi:SOS-response transcriptional repressor LexA
MKDSEKSRPGRIFRQLADDVAAGIADLLRMRNSIRESSRADRDSRFMRWLSTEARAVVDDGIEPDPWSGEQVDALADRMRTSVRIDQSGVRKLSGRPVCLASRETNTMAGTHVPWVQMATAAGIGRELWDEDCETWIDLPDDLPAGKYVALNVTGESMVPLLHDGDVVLVNMAAEPRAGDVVLARTDEGYVVKRLANVSPAAITLESLNPDFPPLVIRDVTRPVAGTVVLRWCEHERSG